LFLADGRTDVTKLIVAFRNFANGLKIRPAVFGLLSCVHNGADGRVYATLYYEHPKRHVVGFILLKIFKVRALYVMYLHTILRAIVHLHLFRRRMSELHMVM
jgi:hypothetical protein